ncbi:MAG TPA: YjgP/YjgQ family permease [Firmicutes bacterium]|nr:YjgP/YjgQ family permease [Bacillota bacterium]
MRLRFARQNAKMITILDTYLAFEFLAPFSLCVLGFIIIVLSGQLFWISDLIIVKKAEAGMVLRLLAYKLPDAIAQSLPFASLFGCVIALSRIAKDSELAAMRTGGMSFKRVILPFMGLSIFISLGSFSLNEWVVPWANHESYNIIRRIAIEESMPQVEENVFIRGTQNRFFYVRKMDPSSRLMQDVMIYETGRDLPRIITARKARGNGPVWYLYNGVVHDLNAEGFVECEARFEQMKIPIEKELANFFENQKTTQEMSRRELKENIDLFARSGINVDPLLVDYHMKLSLPVAASLLTVAGAPLGVSRPRGGRMFGAVVAAMLSFGYFILASVMRSLGANSVLPPLWAAWTPDVVFAIAGIVLVILSERVR